MNMWTHRHTCTRAFTHKCTQSLKHMHMGAHRHTRMMRTSHRHVDVHAQMYTCSCTHMNALHTPRLTHSDPSPCTPVVTQCPVWRGPSVPCPCSACPSVSAWRYIWRPAQPGLLHSPQPQPQSRVHRGPLWAWPEAAPQETHGPCPGPCEGGRAPALPFPCEETESGMS